MHGRRKNLVPDESMMPGADRYLPAWDQGALPEPPRLRWRDWRRYVGPGIVMMGIQIGGGEWLFGPEVTARYGGSLLWLASLAIGFQVFYNLECGRYALYCGEPVTSGFLRTAPGPGFWIGLLAALNVGALIPGLSTHAAATLVALLRGHPPGPDDQQLIAAVGYGCLLAVVLPVLVGGKVYNMLQAVMTVKVVVVLGFCLVLGLAAVRWENWWLVASGFFKIGSVPVADGQGGERVVNLLAAAVGEGPWPQISLASVAVLAAFTGYAGGGGLANSTYSNYVRDQGWGMGQQVGAIASAIGGRQVTLSHVGRACKVDEVGLGRWRRWWRHLLVDQLVVWAPGCVMGMALPALLSLQFAPASPLAADPARLNWAQAMITADGLRHAPGLAPAAATALWSLALVVGLLVLLPSQMSIVDDFSRRWTDIAWTASGRARRLGNDQVKLVYYGILAAYVVSSLIVMYLFSRLGHPKLMGVVIANLNNLALAVTSFHLLYVNCRLLPGPLRPGWVPRLGLVACGLFYSGLSGLVFVSQVWPALRALGT